MKLVNRLSTKYATSSLMGSSGSDVINYVNYKFIPGHDYIRKDGKTYIKDYGNSEENCSEEGCKPGISKAGTYYNIKSPGYIPIEINHSFGNEQYYNGYIDVPNSTVANISDGHAINYTSGSGGLEKLIFKTNKTETSHSFRVKFNFVLKSGATYPTIDGYYKNGELKNLFLSYTVKEGENELFVYSNDNAIDFCVLHFGLIDEDLEWEITDIEIEKIYHYGSLVYFDAETGSYSFIEQFEEAGPTQYITGKVGTVLKLHNAKFSSGDQEIIKRYPAVLWRWALGFKTQLSIEYDYINDLLLPASENAGNFLGNIHLDIKEKVAEVDEYFEGEVENFGIDTTYCTFDQDEKTKGHKATVTDAPSGKQFFYQKTPTIGAIPGEKYLFKIYKNGISPKESKYPFLSVRFGATSGSDRYNNYARNKDNTLLLLPQKTGSLTFFSGGTYSDELYKNALYKVEGDIVSPNNEDVIKWYFEQEESIQNSQFVFDEVLNRPFHVTQHHFYNLGNYSLLETNFILDYTIDKPFSLLFSFTEPELTRKNEPYSLLYTENGVFEILYEKFSETDATIRINIGGISKEFVKNVDWFESDTHTIYIGAEGRNVGDAIHFAVDAMDITVNDESIADNATNSTTIIFGNLKSETSEQCFIGEFLLIDKLISQENYDNYYRNMQAMSPFNFIYNSKFSMGSSNWMYSSNLDVNFDYTNMFVEIETTDDKPSYFKSTQELDLSKFFGYNFEILVEEQTGKFSFKVNYAEGDYDIVELNVGTNNLLIGGNKEVVDFGVVPEYSVGNKIKIKHIKLTQQKINLVVTDDGNLLVDENNRIVIGE